MKKFFYPVSCFLFLVSYTKSQNLVPNPSFENITTCLIGSGVVAFGYEQNWDSPSNGNSDVYNICSISPSFGVPSNGYGVLS